MKILKTELLNYYSNILKPGEQKTGAGGCPFPILVAGLAYC